MPCIGTELLFFAVTVQNRMIGRIYRLSHSSDDLTAKVEFPQIQLVMNANVLRYGGRFEMVLTAGLNKSMSKGKMLL